MQTKRAIPHKRLEFQGGLIALAMAACVCLLPARALAKYEDITVTVEKGQNVRGLAAKYLRNPDLWYAIVEANGLKSVADVRPGMKIRIPVGIVQEAEDALNASLGSIQEATQAGARLFAQDLMTRAIELRDQAVTHKNQARWSECLKSAKDASDTARQAINRSRANSVVAAEAVIREAQGTVQSRKQTDNIWNGRQKNDLLVETEKIRTLSESLAEMQFKNDSLLRLSANSQAIIQKMRVDLLKQKQDSSVSLIEGDLQVLLGGNTKKDDFDLELEDITTNIDSSNFWVEKKKDETKFANYDGELEIISSGGSVVLSENTGSVVKKGSKPTAAKKLLESPLPVLPAVGQPVTETATDMKWAKVEGAGAYNLEVALGSSNFKETFAQRNGIKGTTYTLRGLKPGVYYWRVSAVDTDGLPGATSAARWFRVLFDKDAPYIVLESPAHDMYVNASVMPIRGETEADVALTCNGLEVSKDAVGMFDMTYTLNNGENIIAVRAEDVAGNISEITRRVVYRPDGAVAMVPDEGIVNEAARRFYSAVDGFTLSGTTEPDITVAIASSAFNTKAHADDSGAFSISIPNLTAEGQYDLRLSAPTGFETDAKISVTRVTTPPAIALDAGLPDVTGAGSITISGKAHNAVKLTVNGEPAEMAADGAFSKALKLREGPNEIAIAAYSALGNGAMQRKTIVLDTMPPKLGAAVFSKAAASGGDVVYLRVSASDDSAMKRSADFTLLAGLTEVRGQLTACPGGDCYEGAVNLPPGAGGKVALKSITVGDYAGNTKTYSY